MKVPEMAFEAIAERLRLLADATRLRILNVLREREANVAQIVGKVGASQPNVSRHLALLLRAGVVTRRQQGRQVHYRVVDPFVDQICEAICGSLRAHVDRQAQKVRALRTNSRPAGTPPAATRIRSLTGGTRRRRT